jgi:DNA polymerase-3 subunit beta
MKIICAKEELVKGTQIVQAVVSPRSTLPILANFLIETEEDKIKLSATDLEVGVVCYIKGEVVKEGSSTIPAKRFSDVVKELADGSDIEIKSDESSQINVRSGKSHFVIMGLPKVDYPVLPSFPEEDIFEVSNQTLKMMIKSTAFAVSTDETRYTLNGVNIEIEKGLIKAVATDGRRLAFISREIPDKKVHKKAIIPTKAINEIQRLLAQGKETDQIRIGVTENQVSFRLDGITVMSRLIEGNFPSYEQVIPKKYEAQIKLKTKETLSLVRQMALLVSDKTAIVKFLFGKNVLRISTTAQGLGSGEAEEDIEYSGPNLEIAFNPNFLIDILKNVEDSDVFIELTSPLNPAVIRPVKDKEYVYVIMPMRV